MSAAFCGNPTVSKVSTAKFRESHSSCQYGEFKLVSKCVNWPRTSLSAMMPGILCFLGWRLAMFADQLLDFGVCLGPHFANFFQQLLALRMARVDFRLQFR